MCGVSSRATPCHSSSHPTLCLDVWLTIDRSFFFGSGCHVWTLLPQNQSCIFESSSRHPHSCSTPLRHCTTSLHPSACHTAQCAPSTADSTLTIDLGCGCSGALEAAGDKMGEVEILKQLGTYLWPPGRNACNLICVEDPHLVCVCVCRERERERNRGERCVGVRACGCMHLCVCVSK